MYSEKEIDNIQDSFNARINEQAAQQRKAFYGMLLVALAILAGGFFIGLAFCK